MSPTAQRGGRTTEMEWSVSHRDLGFEVCWLKPRSRLGERDPGAPSRPHVGPALAFDGLEGQLGSGQRVCLVVCLATSSHTPAARQVPGGPIVHLLSAPCPTPTCPGHPGALG